MIYEDIAKSLIMKHEGFRNKVYLCTAGKKTIGYGRNIEDRGVTRSEAQFMLDNDIEMCEEDCKDLFDNFNDLSEIRKAILIDMCYNLGRNRLSKFVNLRRAIDNSNWQIASKEMLNSLWAKQVGKRAERLSNMMLQNDWVV